MTHLMQDILKLSASERILIVQAIWDSIDEKDEKLGLSKETMHLLDERIEKHNNKPEEGSSWDEVKARIKKKF